MRDPAPAYAVAAGGLALLGQAFSSTILYFYVEVLGLSLGRAAAVRTGVLLVSALLWPIAGRLSDRTRGRFGRRRPWLLAGAPILSAAFVLAFAPPATVGLTVLFGAVVFTFDLASAVLWLNHSALFPELFAGYRERVRGSAWKQGLVVVGLVVGTVPVPAIYGSLGFDVLALGYGLAGGAIVVGATLRIAERPAVAPPRPATGRNPAFLWFLPAFALVQLGFQIVSAAVPFYTRHALGLSVTATTALLASFFAGILPLLGAWARRARRGAPFSVYSLALAIAAAGLAILFVAPSLPWALAGGFVLGAGVGGTMLVGDVIIAETIGPGEGGEGAAYSKLTLVTRVVNAALLAPSLALLGPLFGYDGSQHPGERAGAAFRFALCVLPFVAGCLAWPCARASARHMVPHQPR